MTRAPDPARDPAWPPIGRTLGLAFVGWALVAAAVTQIYVLQLPGPVSAHYWWLVYSGRLAVAVLWTLATPFVLVLAHRVRFDRVTRLRFVLVHLAAAALLHVLAAVCDHRLPFARPSSEPPTAWQSLLLDGIVFDTMRYAALVAGRHAADFFVLYQRQRADALQLRAELLEAELTLLRMQLQPHFLFNALHAISELVYRDPRLADRAITRLADLLRGSLASELQAGAPLERELELLDAYLDIERIRAGDALTIGIDAPGEVREASVPLLLLQPIVENALRHGVRGMPDARVQIAARIEGPQVLLTVEDNGRGLLGSYAEGVGLRTTRARLQGLFGDAQSLVLQPRAEGGTRVEIRLPFRRVATAGGAA